MCVNEEKVKRKRRGGEERGMFILYFSITFKTPKRSRLQDLCCTNIGSFFTVSTSGKFQNHNKIFVLVWR